MTTILNYQITEKIFESANSLVYRGQSNEDNQSVILKVLKEDYPSPEKLTHYRQEYEITRDLKIEGVIKADGLERYQNTLVMILEDFGGQSLDQLFDSPLEISEFLSIAFQITEILGEIHAANVIHKNINPSNIVLNPTTGQLKIIDFGISTVLPRENPTLKNPNQLEGTLAYISPEQTGRMNRALDYRTDFYSLGITFYELLTQQLPFTSQEHMKLVYYHLAKEPTPPHNINADIPLVISNIILKLMAKTAEKRYQSAWGLKADLQACQLQLSQHHRIEIFDLGQQDFSEKFQLPQKLYGREREINNLLAAFERTSQGQCEMMLVSGYSGIGKTSLVQETYKPITEKRGYFISGKFDQLQRNIPYTAFVNAFTDLMQQLLTESEKQLIEWKEKILAAIGPNGQVIIEVIPEVELIIGKQPKLPDLPPVESQNRFNLVFQNFIKVFTQPTRPLVIFLDDLQWVDSASLKLTQLLMESAYIQALFLIGAYRDNEVSATHPLILTLREIQQTKAVVNQILLKPLALEHVNQLVADTLHLKNTHQLAELIHRKTGGNPFHLNEFLKSLYIEKLLIFDAKSGHWQWDLTQIEARNFTDNVVELMVDKIKQLSTDTQQALKFAACIGNQFDLTTLAIVLEKTLLDIVADLREALNNGQLLPTKKRLLTKIELETDNWSLITECQFAHDHIQQAAYSLIPDKQKPVIHRQIGQLLLQNTPLDERELNIFAIVDQLNAGIGLIEQQSERDELAQLNLIAGKKAKASAAYQSAFNYLKLGLELLSDDCWETQYDLSLALHEEGAEAAYFDGHSELMEQWIKKVHEQAKTVLDRVKAYELEMQSYQVQNKVEMAFKIGLEILELLGVKFPRRFRKIYAFGLSKKIQLALANKPVEKLIDLPKMEKPEQKAAMRIMASTAFYAYIIANELFLLIVLKMVDLSLKQGNAPASMVGYMSYAMVLCGRLQKVELGNEFGQLALKLTERFDPKESLPTKTTYAYHASITHWKHHIRESSDSLLEVYRKGLELGDLEFAGYALELSHAYSFYCGEKLSEVDKKMRLCATTLSQLKQEKVLNNLKIYYQLISNLKGESAKGESAELEQTRLLKNNIELRDNTSFFISHVKEVIFSYFMEDYSQSIENAYEGEKYSKTSAGFVSLPIFRFYDSLVWLAVYKTATKQEQSQYRKKVQANQKKMKNWAHHAPMNYQHKFDLVEAEWHHHVLGQDAKAMDLYEKAIAGAKENEYLNEEALAYELAAKFYLARGQDKIAQVYFHDAHYAYTRWGAMAKVKQLEEKYSQFFATVESVSSCVTLSGSTRILDATILDLNSMLKASQTIAGEIELGQLLKKLMKIVLENAGAQRGMLILETEGQWFIEAEGAIAQDEVTVLGAIPLEQSLIPVPKSLIEYVIRIQESVVLADAAHEGQFTHEPYFIERQMKSVLCLPLLAQGQLTGVLYLENNQTTDAFTKDRLEMLKLLSFPIVMLIKNARAYKQMADMNIEYQKKIRQLEPGTTC